MILVLFDKFWVIFESILTHLKSESLNRSIVQQVLNVLMENLLFASLDRSIMKQINRALHVLMII